MNQLKWVTNVSPYFVRLERLFYSGVYLLAIGIVTCFLPFTLLRAVIFTVIFIAMLCLPYSLKIANILFAKYLSEDNWLRWRFTEDSNLHFLLIRREINEEEKQRLINQFNSPESQIPAHVGYAISAFFMVFFINLVIMAGGINIYLVYFLQSIMGGDLETNKILYLILLKIIAVLSVVTGTISMTILSWRFFSDYSIFPISPYNIIRNKELGILGIISRFIQSLFSLFLFLFMVLATYYGFGDLMGLNQRTGIERLFIDQLQTVDVIFSLKVWVTSIILFIVGISTFFSFLIKLICDYLLCFYLLFRCIFRCVRKLRGV